MQMFAERTHRRGEFIAHFPVGEYEVVVTFNEHMGRDQNPMIYSRITVYHKNRDVTETFLPSYDFTSGETPGEMMMTVMAKLAEIIKK